MVLPYNRAVCGNDHYVEPVYFQKFLGRGFGRTRHAGKLFVEPEIILESYRSRRASFFLYFDAFFCFYCLMYAFAPAPTRLEAAGKWVYYDHFSFFNYIILITLKYCLSFDRRFQMMHVFYALFGINIVYSEDRKSTRLNSSHQIISYAVFCLKKKKKNNIQ